MSRHPSSGPRTLLAGGLAAVAARAAYAALNQRPPGGREAWARTNHRGEPVTLLEGPAAAAGAAASDIVSADQHRPIGIEHSSVQLLGSSEFYHLPMRIKYSS